MSASQLVRWLDQGWSVKPRLHAVDVQGAAVRYRAWGLDDTAKPGLLLAHGFIAHARWWDHIAPRFCDRYRVIAPDFTGMGDSDRRDDYSRRQYGRELIASARHAGFDQVTIIAHSFGSGPALHAAALAPELVTRAVLVDSRLAPVPDTDGAARSIEPERQYPDRQTALERYRLTPPGAWPVPEIVDYIARHSLRQTDEGRWAWKFDPLAYRALGRREALGGELRTLAVPVDFVHAADSEVVSPDDITLHLPRLPGNPSVVTVPLSHHHIMVEQPVGLVAALNGLLAHSRS